MSAKFRILLSSMIVLLLAFSATASAQRGRSPTIKAGLVRASHSAPTFTLAKSDGSLTTTNADPMVGNDMFLEYILFGRLGLEVRSGMTAAVRNYQLTDANGAIISNVKEEARPTMMGLNLYFSSHESGTLKPYVGLGSGRINVNMDFSSGSLGPQQSKHKVPINTIKFGVDWVKDNAGARLEVLNQSGSNIDSTSIPTYSQTADYTTTVIGLALFAFF